MLHVDDQGRATPVLALLAAAAVLIGATVAYLFAPYESNEELVAPGDTPMATSVETRPPDSDERPLHLAVIDRDGRLRLVDAIDGSTVNVVGERVALDGRLPHLVATAGSVEVYVTDPAGPEVRFVRMATGQEEVTAHPARSPALGSEDERLAYVVPGTDGATDRIHIQHLVTGESRELGSVDQLPEVTAIRSVIWGPSGERLFLVVEQESALRTMFVVDAEAETLAEAEPFPAVPPQRAAWIDAAPYRDQLVVIEACCGSDPVRSRLLRVDDATGEVLEELEAGIEEPVRSVDTDEHQRHLLLVAGTLDGGAATVYHWNEQGSPVALLGGVLDASW